MNIQLAEEYKTCREGVKERGFLGSRSRGSREKDIGARAREKESEPGARTRRMESEPGPREKRDAVRNMSMKRRRD